MSIFSGRTKIFRRVLAALLAVVAILLIVNIFYIRSFNSKVWESVGCAEDASFYLDLDGRSDSTSTWQKRDFDWGGETVTLNAQTFDGVLTNNSKYSIGNWTCRLNIHDDCFINNAWCGTMEIHQHVGTAEEKVQTLDLRDYDLDDVILDHSYDGDLLIPLSEGDYVIYYPSAPDQEVPFDAEHSATIGMIFYYLDLPELGDYTIEYQFGRNYSDSNIFVSAVVLAAVWLFLLVQYVISLRIYRSAEHEMEVRKSGIQTMSDIYSIIYIIDLVKDELVPVAADEKSEKLRPKEMAASEQMRNLFEWDCVEAYKDIVLEFADLTTLAQRLENRNTLVCEYISRDHGWCSLRFFVMDRDESGNAEKVVFTIQEINEEKAEIEEFSNRVNLAEQASKEKSSFLANVSREIQVPVSDILQLNRENLGAELTEDAQDRAKRIDSIAKIVMILLDGILDYSEFERSGLTADNTEYSLSGLIDDIDGMFSAPITARNIEFQIDRSAKLPDRLLGDKKRLEEALIHLLTNAFKNTVSGKIRVSVYGKETEGKVHLLFSVKDTGCGIDGETVSSLQESFTGESAGDRAYRYNSIGLNLVKELLSLMDSSLHIISMPDDGTELYFELEQEIIGGQEER